MLPNTEDDSDYDGAFSYAGEVHAFVIGLAVGVATVVPSRRLKRFVYSGIGLGDATRSKAMQEVRAESWYAFGGVLAGMTAAFLVLAILVSLATRLV